MNRSVTLHRIVAFAYLLGSTVMVQAQEKKKDLESSLPIPGEFASWKVTVSEEDGEGETDGDRLFVEEESAEPKTLVNRPVVFEYSITEHTAKCMITYTKGYIEESYLIHGMRLYSRSDNPDRIRMTRGNRGHYNVWEGYPGFWPFEKKHYKGVVEAFEQECHYYTIADDKKFIKESDIELYEGWISKKTGLPVAYRTADGLAQYQFNKSPTQVIRIPEKYIKHWMTWFSKPPAGYEIPD
ncbi:MAG: hypothetical protein AAGA18_06180 [Verrucomicrobiota bacterium]